VTLIEFIAAIKSKGYKEEALATLLYAELHEGLGSLAAGQIRDRMKSTRIKRADRINVSDVLARAGHYAHNPNSGGWSLTPSGRNHIRELLGLPATDIEKQQDVGKLQTVVSGISDPVIRDYVGESLICLQYGALRACVVFAWTGAIRVVHERMLTGNHAALNSALKKHDPKARDVSQVDHFAYIKDKTTLLRMIRCCWNVCQHRIRRSSAPQLSKENSMISQAPRSGLAKTP
jgi:hypothetical protein